MLYPIELLRHKNRQRALHSWTGSMLTSRPPFVMHLSGFLHVGPFRYMSNEQPLLAQQLEQGADRRGQRPRVVQAIHS